MKKSEQIFIENEDGEFVELDRNTFIKLIVSEHEIGDIQFGEAIFPSEEVAKGLLSNAETGEEIEEAIEEKVPGVYGWIVEKLTASKEHVSSLKDKEKEEKEAKAKEKEAEKQRKKEEEELMVKRQTDVAKVFSKGAKKADSAFKKELEGLKAGLPKGIEIVANKGKGFGLEIADDVSDEDLGSTVGYFLQKEQNSQFMQHTAGFFVGELCNRMVSANIYRSKIKAAEAIAAKAEEMGRKVHPRGIESYARMAERIPLEMRNSEVVDKAYLELANAKKCKREKNEDKAAFKTREEAYENERLEIAKKLATGELAEVKDVKEKIAEMQIKHGLKDKPDPEKKTIGDYLRIFFYGTTYVENLSGVHDEDCIVFQEKGSKDQLSYNVSEIKETVEEARLNLVNALINFDQNGQEITLSDLMEGNKEMEVPVLNEKGKDSGKKTKAKVDVFPRPFFDVPKPKEEEKKEVKRKKGNSEEE